MRTIAKVSLNLNKLCGAQAEARKKMGWQHWLRKKWNNAKEDHLNWWCVIA
jgi:hypothetical protein